MTRQRRMQNFERMRLKAAREHSSRRCRPHHAVSLFFGLQRKTPGNGSSRGNNERRLRHFGARTRKSATQRLWAIVKSTHLARISSVSEGYSPNRGLTGWRSSAIRTGLRCKFPARGKLTRNFAENTLWERENTRSGQENWAFLTKFPTKGNREAFSRNREFQRVLQGLSVSVQRSHTCRPGNDHDLFSPSICKLGENRWRANSDRGSVSARTSGERIMRRGSVAT
jgi:hypothetical protein